MDGPRHIQDRAGQHLCGQRGIAETGSHDDLVDAIAVVSQMRFFHTTGEDYPLPEIAVFEATFSVSLRTWESRSPATLRHRVRRETGSNRSRWRDRSQRGHTQPAAARGVSSVGPATGEAAWSYMKLRPFLIRPDASPAHSVAS